jgi:hypothetical protein
VARRKNRKRIQTASVQGDDSYVVVTLPSVADIRAIAALEGQNAEAFDGTVKIIAEHVHEWNWVDDDDKPLPSPVADPTVVELLTTEEYKLLVQLLLGSEETRKN